ncbi:MAG: permease-like cell division protein FtsX [Bacillota bacterium]
MIRFLVHAVREAFISIRRNAPMSLISVSTVALCLFMLGSMVLLSLNIDAVTGTLEGQVELTLYLETKVDEGGAREIMDLLSRLDEVREVRYVSKEEALERLRRQFGDQQGLLDGIAHMNPLPASIEVNLVWPEGAGQVAAYASGLPGVEEVAYAKDTVEQLLEITRLIRLGGYMLVMVLVAATCLLVANTIRLTVFARRRQIAIMRLVGATDAFIKGPFAVEGIILGLAGAGLAAVMVKQVYLRVVSALSTSIPFLPLLPPGAELEAVVQLLLGTGTAIGAVGSVIAVRRFLGAQGG